MHRQNAGDGEAIERRYDRLDRRKQLFGKQTEMGGNLPQTAKHQERNGIACERAQMALARRGNAAGRKRFRKGCHLGFLLVLVCKVEDKAADRDSTSECPTSQLLRPPIRPARLYL